LAAEQPRLRAVGKQVVIRAVQLIAGSVFVWIAADAAHDRTPRSNAPPFAALASFFV
jgi:hypothetical protein